MFLKNKIIIFKIRRSNVTDYAALNDREYLINLFFFFFVGGGGGGGWDIDTFLGLFC